MGLFIPTYFSPITQYEAIVNTSDVVFEIEDNYQKQTYRNRCYIYGANGKQLLNIPVTHLSSTKRKKTKDTLIDNSVTWQKQHLKSLQTAYKSSPFYEFYEDDLQMIFNKTYKYLIDVNIDTFLFLIDALQIDKNYTKTLEYKEYKINDFRYLANAKGENQPKQKEYTQVFDNKYGFIPNLSALDLLFMEGPNAISFLAKKILT